MCQNAEINAASYLAWVGLAKCFVSRLFFGDKNVMEETERTLRFWRFT